MQVGDLLTHEGEYALVLENRQGFVLLFWFDDGEEVWECEKNLKTYTEAVCK